MLPRATRTARDSIERCQTPDFETAPFPTRPLVPYVEVVHDRIAIEIMRGCPQRCRFCHAGYTKRPLALRSVRQHHRNRRGAVLGDRAARDRPAVALHGRLSAPARAGRDGATSDLRPRQVNISVPSLRVDKMLQNIPWMVSAVRKSGLTIAVEAANDDMRAAIRKKVTDGNLLDGIRRRTRPAGSG